MNKVDLFLRYAEGCRCYLEDKGMISEQDKKSLDSGNPSYEVLRRVFYVAVPGLEKLAKKMGRNVFDHDVLKHYYAFDHNERKFREGNLICLALPARILETNGKNSYFIELEPVRGKFQIFSDLNLEQKDWVMFHRINLVEKIPEKFAEQVAEFLQKLGLDKSYKFPKVAIKYLKRLQTGAGVCTRVNP